jgi:hypothetical protein
MPVTNGKPRARSAKQLKRGSPKTPLPIGGKKARSPLPPLRVRGPRGLSTKPVRTDAPGDGFDVTRFTRPEWYLYWYLTVRKKLIHQQDFRFQSSLLGGRRELGGVVADFQFFDRYYPPGLIVNVDGYFWHSFRSEDRAKDLENRIRLEGDKGIRFVSLSEDDIIAELESPGSYPRVVEAALLGEQIGRAAWKT